MAAGRSIGALDGWGCCVPASEHMVVLSDASRSGLLLEGSSVDGLAPDRHKGQPFDLRHHNCLIWLQCPRSLNRVCMVFQVPLSCRHHAHKLAVLCLCAHSTLGPPLVAPALLLPPFFLVDSLLRVLAALGLLTPAVPARPLASALMAPSCEVVVALVACAGDP